MKARSAGIDRPIVAFCLSTLLAGPVAAGEIVYRPINPAFGGDPNNGVILLNNANAQNHYRDTSTSASLQNPFSPLQQFTQALQSSVLSRVAGSISSQVVDANGNLIPGTFTIGNIQVVVASGTSTLTITTTDVASGQSTTFEVPK